MGDYMMALIDAIIALFTFGLFTYVWVTRKHKFAGGMICVLYLTAALIVVHLQGPNSVYWAYPATIGCFCILNTRLAIILCAATISILFPMLHGTIPTDQLSGIFTTLILLCIFGYIFNDSVHRQRRQLSTLAARDALTGTWNRRALDETLIQTTSSNNRNPLIASLIMLDLDHFKRINDTYGHDVGDTILIKISAIIKESIRLSDRLYRYGGEEFVVIADGANLENAAILAESIRKKIESSCLLDKENITISLGVASLMEGQNPETWIKLADEALYEAKRTGRNKFCLSNGKSQQHSMEENLLSA
jgi:diguanylate cyclase (GGDEF)-like protein